MGRALAVPQRQVILERQRQGHRHQDIAADLGLNPATVRRLMARFERHGPEAVAPGYARCGQAQPRRPDPAIIQAACELKARHPGWGAGIIRVHLAERFDPGRVPAQRTIERALNRAGFTPAPTTPRSRPGPKRRAPEPHHTWQMDAADQIPLADGRGACWLRIVDECSGAVLQAVVFPPAELGAGAGDGHA